MYELYGTYLTHQVKEIIGQKGPIKVSEIAEELAPHLDDNAKKNLCKRIRHSLNQLCAYQIVIFSYDFSQNIPTKQFSINEQSKAINGDGESSRQQERKSNGRNTTNGRADADATGGSV